MKEDAILFSTDFFDVLLAPERPSPTLFATYFGELINNLKQIAYLKDIQKIILSISTYISISSNQRAYSILKEYIDIIRKIIENQNIIVLGEIYVVEGTIIFGINNEYVGLNEMMISTKGFRLANYANDLEKYVNLKWICVAEHIDCLEIKEALKDCPISHNIFVSGMKIDDPDNIIYSSEEREAKGINNGLSQFLQELRDMNTPYPRESTPTTSTRLKDFKEAENIIIEISEMIKRIGNSEILTYEDKENLEVIKSRLRELLNVYGHSRGPRLRGMRNILWQAKNQLEHIENFTSKTGFLGRVKE